jgi:glycosyltransferase involved in cell wall biosynthesis
MYSFIMPNYNKETYIADAIQSIMDQTRYNWELIIVDDKSTDASVEVIKHFAHKEPRIRWVQNLYNQGIAMTRNAGIKLAKGDWLCVQDSDDISLPQRLETFEDTLKKQPDMEFFYSTIEVADQGLDIYDRWMAEELTAKKLRKDQVVAHATCIYKADLGIMYRPGQRMNDDLPFIVDHWNAGTKFGYTIQPTVVYRVLPEGISSQNFKEIRKESKKWHRAVKNR